MSYAKLLDNYINETKYPLADISIMCKSKGVEISPSYISKLRTGKKPPPSDNISRALAEVLGGDPEALVIEGYKERAPQEAKKILSTGSLEVGSVWESSITYGSPPRQGSFLQRTGRSGRRYSMVIELADILENDNIQVTVSGEPLDTTRRLNLLNAIDKPITKSDYNVPLIGTIKAGIPLLSEHNIIGEIDIPADLEGKIDFALTVSGDSMIGAGINDGDIVICKQKEIASHGQIVVALVNDSETTLKYFIQENGRSVLKAANPEYPDFELKPGDKIQGYVVRIQKEPPPINVYKEYIYCKEGHLAEWNQVIEKALSYGVDPEQVDGVIEMQWNMLQKLQSKK